jgi:hypothetical protein
MSDNLLGYLILGAAAYVLLLSIWRRREAIQHNVRRLVIFMAVYLGGFILLTRHGQAQSAAAVLSLLAAAVIDSLQPKRSRYVLARERRKAIARYERSGEKYSPRKHEVDHEVPFSTGGSNTSDNLQVISRKKNRAKAAKAPWWDVLGW